MQTEDSSVNSDKKSVGKKNVRVAVILGITALLIYVGFFVKVILTS